MKVLTSDHQDNALRVQAVPHPFSVERVDYCLKLGLSIEEILEQVQPDPILRNHAHVFIEGDYIPRDKWRHVRPRQNCIVNIRMVPQGGGGGKNPLRTVLSVALMAATPYLGALAGSSLGGVFSMSLGQKALAGGLNFMGRLALNAIAPPAQTRYKPRGKDDRTQFIHGAQNKAEPFAAVPQVLGTHRLVPPLGARPFTEIVGEDQYVRMLFVWGYGPLEIRDLKIGETPLSEFDDVEIETRNGGEDHVDLNLFPDVVLQNDLHVKLTKAAGYEIRTTEEDVDEISIDILFPNGLVGFNGKGARVSRKVHIEVQYAPHGTEDWSAGSFGYKTIGGQNLSITPPGARYAHFGLISHAYRYNKRIDSVVIDRMSGAASIITGTPVSGFNQYGDVHDSHPVTAAAPTVPEGKIEVARIVSLGNTAGTEIIDCKKESDLGVLYETLDDFTVEVSGSQVQVAAGRIRFSGFEVTAKQANALRRAIRFQVPRGQYDIRIRRITDDHDSDKIFDDVYWSALRSIRNEDPIRQTGVAVTALRIKATDQLNGTIDRFNGVVSSILPDWDGEVWRDQVSANPAALFRHVLQGRGNARPLPDERIDLETLQDWHYRCAEAGREFNAVIESGYSVMEVLRDIAAAGRASPTLTDGRWAVIEDKIQETPVQHFTPRNSYGFEAERSFEDHPHALRIKFNNRDKGWQLDERLVYDDGYDAVTAHKFEGLELTGITDPEQVWKDGRYHIASARLRPESYRFYTDIEHIVCTRGDLIRLTHDAALIGLGSARIVTLVTDEQSAAITGVRLDAQMTMEAGRNYVLRIRKSDGSSVVRAVVTAAGTSDTLDFISSVTDISIGDLCVFGESGRESVALIVKAIEPQDNFGARITCVNAAPEIHQADQGEIPDFDSYITIPPELERPAAPILQSIQSGAEVLQRNTDGSFSPQIVVTLVPPNDLDAIQLKARIREKDTSYFKPVSVRNLDGHSFALSDVEESILYDLELRYVRANNIASDVFILPGYEVIGAADIPGEVDNFAMNVVSDMAHLTWDAVTDVDLSHYKIKFCSDLLNEPSWNTAVDLVSSVPRTATSAAVPVLSGYYLIKAIDLGGRESAAPAIIQTNMADAAHLNVVETIEEGAAFDGEMTNLTTAYGGLRLSGADHIDDWPLIDDVENIDIGLAGYAMTGSYQFAESCDLGSVFTARLTASMQVGGLDLNQTIDDRINIDQIENWDNNIDPEKWSVVLQIRTTSDDPAAVNPEWSPWRNFVIGDYTARGFDFRVLLSSAAAGVTPILSDISVVIDMPDRVIADQDLLSDLSGTAISFAKPFHIRPAVAISAQSLQTGDYYELSNVTKSGFFIQFFDRDDTAIARRFDYLVKGYGRET